MAHTIRINYDIKYRKGDELNGIMYVWRKVYHTEADISESKDGVDRTTLTLSFNGNEMDMHAMLKLYDDAEELELSGKEDKDLPDKTHLLGKAGQELPDKVALSGKITEKICLSGNLKEKLPMTEAYIDKLSDIYFYISRHQHSSKEDIAVCIGRSEETTKKFLRVLVTIKMITAEGGGTGTAPVPLMKRIKL